MKSGNLSLSEKNNLDCQKWKIQSAGNSSYNLYSKEYPSLKIDTINNGRLKATNSGSIRWNMEKMKELSLPNCTFGHQYTNTMSSLNIYPTIGSTITNGSTLYDLLNSTQACDMMFGSWNSITNSIIVHYPNEQQLNSNNIIVIFELDNTMNSNEWAETVIHYDSVTNLVDYFEIKVNALHNNNDDISLLKHYICHELGHVLDLAHVQISKKLNYELNPDGTYMYHVIDNTGYHVLNSIKIQEGYYAEELDTINVWYQNSLQSIKRYKPEQHEVLSLIQSGNYLDNNSSTITPSFLDKVNLIRRWDTQ